MGRLFDTHVIVDWSARSAPSPARPTKDAIWWAGSGESRTPPTYARTRSEAVERLAHLIGDALDAGRRVLVGFDFPFGFPEGVAARITGQARAPALWEWLANEIQDGPDNANNRYAVASAINRRYEGIGPFWGRPATCEVADVPARASARRGRDHPQERRRADERARGAKTVWQLAYAGSVGSQVLLGLPALRRLAAHPRLAGRVAVWPFDEGLGPPSSQAVLAEVYPSLIAAEVRARRGADEILDAAQVRVNADAFAALDDAGRLAPLFEGSPDLSAADRAAIETEEAWILGLGHEDALRAALAGVGRGRIATVAEAAPKSPSPGRLRYERDPAAIYRQSFAIVEAEARLDHLPEELRDVAIRLVHSCGMVDLPNRLAWSDDVAESARSALRAGAPVICDCEMAAAGIIRRLLPEGVEVLVTLNDPRTPDLAKSVANTRSAAAVELWRDRIEGAVVAIGNAPTALFHLLELLDQGWPKPAAILAFPVGFVGAAESKAELAANPRGVPFLTLRGRRGGSAMASAAVNALAGGLA